MHGTQEIAPELRNLLSSENSRILLRSQIRPRNMNVRVFVMYQLRRIKAEVQASQSNASTMAEGPLPYSFAA